MNALATLQPPAAAVDSAPEEPLYEIVNGQKVELPPTSVYSNGCIWILVRPQQLTVLELAREF